MHSDSATFATDKSRETSLDADAMKITPSELSEILACASNAVAPRFRVRVAGHFCCMLLCPKYEVGLRASAQREEAKPALFARGVPRLKDASAVRLMHTYCLFELANRAESAMSAGDINLERAECLKLQGMQASHMLKKKATALRKKCGSTSFLTSIDAMCRLMRGTLAANDDVEQGKGSASMATSIRQDHPVCIMCRQGIATPDAPHTRCALRIAKVAKLAGHLL